MRFLSRFFLLIWMVFLLFFQGEVVTNGVDPDETLTDCVVTRRDGVRWRVGPPSASEGDSRRTSSLCMLISLAVQLLVQVRTVSRLEYNRCFFFLICFIKGGRESSGNN